MSDVAVNLPADVTSLLATHVKSIEALEILLFVRPYQGQALTCTFVSERLGRDWEIVTRVVDHLQRTGLFASDPSAPDAFRLSPTRPQAMAVDALARIYASDPLQVVTYLAQRAMERIRGTAAQAFADSFRIRGKKE